MNTDEDKGAGLRFQHEVFELVAERLRKQYRNASLIVSNYNRGPIDIVVDLTRTIPSITEDPVQIAERIYIECKRHSRKIDMDTAGKAFCRAVIDRPDFLIIVSDTVLAPETVEYALQLFSCCNATQVVINRDRFPITNTKFLHYTLQELRGISQSPHLTRSSKANDNRVIEVGWILQEVDKCGTERPVCSTKNAKPIFAARLDVDYILRVIVSFDFPLHTAGAGRLPQIYFSDVMGARLESLRPQHMRQGETFVTLDFPVSKAGVLELVTHLTIQIGSQIEHRVSLSLPHLVIVDNQPLIGDLRGNLVDDLTVKALSGTSVFLLGGVGGIGKSYLAEKLCQKLVEQGYSNRTHIWHEDDDDSVFYQMALPQLLDRNGMDKSAFQELAASYVVSLSENAGAEIGTLKNPNLLATAATVCAQALAQTSMKVVWLLQNCHEMSPSMIVAIRAFIQQCQKLCPNARFILEYRDGDASPKWLEFVNEFQENRNLTSVIIPLEPISYRSLHASLVQTTIGLDVSELARELLSKTAGNPLYIDSLLRHWMSLGYLRLHETEAGRKLHIESLAAIKSELDELPQDVRKFLPFRLEHLISTHKNGLVLATFLYISSLMPRSPRLSVLSQACSQSISEIETLLRDCISENILRPSSDSESFVFTHEFLRLATQLAACSFVPQETTKRVESVLDKPSGWDCILAGRMYLGLKGPTKAREWFYRASGLLHDDYTLLRMALTGLRDSLKWIEPANIQDRIGRVDVCLDLGWAESQGGRMVDARLTFANTLEEVEQLFDPFNDEHWRIARHLRARIYHRLVTVEIEMVLLASALDNFRLAMREVSDKSTLYHLSNRLVLAAEILGCTKSAWEAADIGLKLADNVNAKDMRAVIRSDVGRLYLFSSPGTALNLWQDGLTLAEETRQVTHARADVLTAKLVCGENVTEAEIAALRDEIKNRVPAQVPRLEMLIGACRYSNGDIDGAARSYARAASLANINGQTALRAGSLINLGLLYRLLFGETSDPLPLYEAQACLSPLAVYGEELELRLAESMTALKKSAHRLSGEFESASTNHPCLPSSPPLAMSAMLQMIATLQEAGFGLTSITPDISNRANTILHHCGFVDSLRLPDTTPLIIL